MHKTPQENEKYKVVMNTLTKDAIEHNTKLLIEASNRGDFDEVKRLIPVSDPKFNHSEALLSAVVNGYIDIVKLLIPVSDPKANYSWALLNAAHFGHADIVKLLIPVSDPKASSSYALQAAASKSEIIQLLLPFSDYYLAKQELLECNKNITVLQQCIDEYEALQQKERLISILDERFEKTNPSIKRKM